MSSKGRSPSAYFRGSVALLLGAVLVLSAWSWQGPEQDSTSVTTTPDSVEVEVVVNDEGLDLSETSVEPGPVVFEITNKGSVPHSFAITRPAEERLQGKIAAGETETLEVTLDAGTYTVRCPLEGHSQKEAAELTVGK